MSDIDDRYRRAAGNDLSRPSDATRKNILANARRLAAERSAMASDPPSRMAAAHHKAPPDDRVRPTAESPTTPHPLQTHSLRRARWRLATVGTLAAAALAGLLITPHFLRTGAITPPVDSTTAPAPLTAPVADTPLPFPASPAPKSAPPRTASTPLEYTTAPPAPDRTPRAASPAQVTGDIAAWSKAAVPLPSDGAARRSIPGPSQTPVHELGATAAGSLAAPPQPAVPASPPPHSALRSLSPDRSVSLRQAAAAGDMEGLEALLDSADVDARDAAGRTALMLAAAAGRTPAVEALLAHGADPNAVDANGRTPLQLAQSAGHHAIAVILQRAGAHGR